MIELALNGVAKYFGATEVLKNINFEVQTAEKVGLVGRNGSGKSTILKIISGIEKHDKGSVMIKKGCVVGYLAQIPEYPENYTVSDVLNSAFEKVIAIEQQMKSLEIKMKELASDEIDRALKQYSELQQRYEIIGGYEREEKLSKVCIGLKFDYSFKNQFFNLLSGGEKTTVVLGKMLLENPQLLLLDEPTNHLDVEAVEWLEEYLKQYKGMVLIVSHDRYFLDRVVTKIIEVEDMESETYLGNYSTYVKTKEEKVMLEFEAFQDQQKKIKAMEKAIKDLRDWAIRADNNKFFRRAASMQKRLDKMEKLDKPVLEKQNMKLNVNQAQRSGEETIKIKNLTKSFDNKILIENGEMLIRYGERAALIGVNGSGKSTLLKILLGEETADLGEALLGASVKTGYLPQQIDFPDEGATVLESFRDGITISEGNAREYLAKYLFFGESVFKKVKSLSGGEKSRLKLGKLLFEDVNLLILDEPTNHLDIDSIETLEETLLDFQGTILFISHDRYFINKLCSYIVSLENRALVKYHGNYEYYRDKKQALKQVEVQKSTVKKEKPQRTKVVDEEKKKEKLKLKLEEQIADFEEAIVQLDLKMNLKDIDYVLIQQYYQEKQEVQQKLDEVLEQWMLL
jgi:ATPase subunit of ABC transporter with duplicated ATPase domains